MIKRKSVEFQIWWNKFIEENGLALDGLAKWDSEVNYIDEIFRVWRSTRNPLVACRRLVKYFMFLVRTGFLDRVAVLKVKEKILT